MTHGFPDPDARLIAEPPPSNRRGCSRCGKSLLRSHARTLTDRVMRRVVGLRLYRCDSCGHREWHARSGRGERGTPIAAQPPEKPSHSNDPLAFGIQRRRWRKLAFAYALVVFGGLAVGLVIGRVLS